MIESTCEKVCNLKNIMALSAESIIGFRRWRQQDGYAMAALLVAMSVMAIMLTIAMPTWSQMIRRDNEAELIFRGEQYARAINQYQRKYANQSPPSLDQLIEQRMLRKKYKDPLSPNKDGEFALLYFQTGSQGSGPQGTGSPGTGGRGAGTQGTGTQGTGSQGTGSRGGSAGGTSFVPSPSPGMAGSIGPSGSMKGPIVGVASKNTGASLRVYNGKTRYNEWQFIGMEMSSRAGPGSGGSGAPGFPGGRGGPGRGRGANDGRGGRGGDPFRGSDGGRSGFPPSRGGRGF
jgi:type II secretory pathway pseudopilin PulG